MNPRDRGFYVNHFGNRTGIRRDNLYYDGKHWKNAYTEFYYWLISNLVLDDKNAIISHNGTTFDFIFLQRLIYDLHKESENISQFEQCNIYYIDTLLLSRKVFSIHQEPKVE